MSKGKVVLPDSFYFKAGKRCVLLLHAYSGSPNDVRMMGRYLESHDYSVYAPMFKGHGTLDPEDILKESPSIWWEETKKSLDFLKEEGYEELAVLGLSMGGIFSTRVCEEYKGWVIGGGSFCSPIFQGRGTTVLPHFIEYCKKVLTYGNLDGINLEEQIQRIYPKAEAQLQQILHFSDEISQKLDKISIPIFLAQAGQDEMIDPESVYSTAKAIKNAFITLKWYPNSTHVITVGSDHKQLEQDVLTFLNTLSWS